MRDIVSPLSGFGSPFGQRRRAAQIITAIITPALGPLTDGDTIASALSADIGETGNYASTEGTISTVDVVITVNGDPALASDTVDFEDVVAVTVTVTDTEANQRVFNLSRVALDIAPVATGGIADQEYTEGVAITPLDVAADFTGSNLTFALAPSSAALPAGLSLSSAGELTGTPTTEAAEVNIVVRATNSAGTADTAFGVTIAEASTGLPDLAYDVLLEAYDPASLFSDTAGTTAASVDGSVARINDTSGNGNHATQPIVAARPTRRQLDDLNWLDHDGVGDRSEIAGDASWRKTAQSFVAVIRRDPSRGEGWLVGNISGQSRGFGFMENSSTGGASNPSAAAYYTNGAAITGTVNAGVLHTEWSTGDWTIVEVAGCPLTGSNFNGGVQFPGTLGTNFISIDDYGFFTIIPTAILDTGTNRADLVAGLANIFGITL